MKQIGLGIMQYNQDYDERMPNMYFNSSPQVWWQGMLQPYVKNWAIFKCPSNPDVLTVTTDGVGYRNHYSPNLLCNNNNNIIFSTVGQNAGAWQGGGGTGQPLSIFDNPSTTISIFELHNYNSYSTPDSASFTANPTFSGLYSGHLGTSNYLFVDGHVKAMRPLATITPGKNLWTRDNSDTGPTSSLRCSYTQLTLFLQAAENTFN